MQNFPATLRTIVLCRKRIELNFTDTAKNSCQICRSASCTRWENWIWIPSLLHRNNAAFRHLFLSSISRLHIRRMYLKTIIKDDFPINSSSYQTSSRGYHACVNPKIWTCAQVLINLKKIVPPKQWDFGSPTHRQTFYWQIEKSRKH